MPRWCSGPQASSVVASAGPIRTQSRTGEEGNLTCRGSPWLLCKGDMEKHAVSNNDSTRRFNQAKLSAI